MQDPTHIEFRNDQIGRDPGQMEHQRLDPEPASPRLGDLPLDHVQVAVVHVDPPSVDPQPGSAVEHAAAPAADLEDLTGPADVAQRLRVEAAAVVDREVPVAVRPVGALPLDPPSVTAAPGQLGEATGDVPRNSSSSTRPKLPGVRAGACCEMTEDIAGNGTAW